MELVEESGRAGFPDEELGVRFSRKVGLELRGVARASVAVSVCVVSRTGSTIGYQQQHALGAPRFAVPLGSFARDSYVLYVRVGLATVRAIPFASE